MKSLASRTIPIALVFVCLPFALVFFTPSSTSEPIDPDKLPLAFWSWRSETPSADDVRAAVSATRAKLLFLRAGQIDLDGKSLKRIRSPKGRFPEGIEIHLVYNATRGMLGSLDEVSPERIASAIAASYYEDVDRTRAEGVRVTGIQVDFDYPTRLLPEYAAMLQSLNGRLPHDVQVSITGLPTWTESDRLANVLDQVDFWIPQFYGAAIPTRISDPRSISSTAEVSGELNKVSELQKPYYAGLSAYGYALLFDRQGELVEVRGDIDRSRVHHDPAFMLDATLTSHSRNGESRSVYKATRPTVVEGATINEGEFLVFDESTAASLRATARTVRRDAREPLLGICVFRLPSVTDPTNLRIDEVADAIFDREGSFRSDVHAAVNQDGTVEISVSNTGTGGVRFGEGEMALDIPARSVPTIEQINGFVDVRTLCATQSADQLIPCGPRRADLKRLVAETWRPGDKAFAKFKAAGEFTVRLTVIKNGSPVESVEKRISTKGEE